MYQIQTLEGYSLDRVNTPVNNNIYSSVDLLLKDFEIIKGSRKCLILSERETDKFFSEENLPIHLINKIETFYEEPIEEVLHHRFIYFIVKLNLI